MSAIRYIDDTSGRIGVSVRASMERDFDGEHAAPWHVRFYLDKPDGYDWLRGLMDARGVMDDFGDFVLPDHRFGGAA